MEASRPGEALKYTSTISALTGSESIVVVVVVGGIVSRYSVQEG